MNRKGFMKHLLGSIIAAVFVIAVSLCFNTTKASAGELGVAEDGQWRYYDNGNVIWNYTGMACNDYGWWYLNNGTIDFGFNGMAANEYGWFYFTNGALNWNYTGMALNEYGWWYIRNGALDLGFNGMAANENGWFYFTNGALNWGYNGMACNGNGWFYFTNGALNWNFTGMAANENGWFYFSNGELNWSYTGMACNEYGWWYMTNGVINWGYTGMAANENGWFYFTNGALNWGYTGIASNSYGYWYMQNGSLNGNFTGTVEYNGDTYDVTNGAAVKRGQPSYEPGAAATGKLEGENWYIIRSTVDPSKALTVSKDKTSDGGYNLVMDDLTGSNAQKFRVLTVGDNSYMIMSMEYFDGSNVNWPMNGGDAIVGVDNVQMADNSVNGYKSWMINESEAGVYTIQYTIAGRVYSVAAQGLASGSNVKVEEGAATQFNFVSPYKKTIEDGVYTIASLSKGGYNVAIQSSGMNDTANVVAAAASLESDQNFSIQCTDASKGLYKIKNLNSGRNIDNRGSLSSGSQLIQLFGSTHDDQLWYIQKDADGTYHFINALSKQYMAVNGDAIIQQIGSGSNTENFAINAQVTGATEKVLNDAYVLDNTTYRINSLGDGVYTIFDVARNQFVGTDANGGIVYNSSSDLAAQKWVLKNNDGSFALVSAVTSTVFVGNVFDMTIASNASYSTRYDLTALDSAFLDSNLQIASRFQTLGLSKNDLMNPKQAMTDITPTITGAAVSGEVEYTGTEVSDLNTFLVNNMGKVVKLTQDINVYNGGTTNPGTVMIPSNTILDGNNHSLVMKNGQTAVPDTAIIFQYYTSSTGFVLSTNAGVKNLKTSVAYNYDVNLLGASNITIEHNEFSNAQKHSIMLSTDKGFSENVVIKDNVLNNIGGDGVTIAGNHSKILVTGNTITNIGGQAGILVSCLKDGTPIKVDQETTGPHDIVITNNTLDRFSAGCAIYCIGAYRTYMTDNTLSNSYLEGMCLDSGCIGGYFANNIVTGCSRIGGLPGVSIDNGVYNVIEGNTISNNGCGGIKLVRTALGNIVVNNTCYDNAVNTYNQYTKVNGDSCGVYICAQALETELGDLLDATGSNGNVVMGNKISGAHTYGICIDKDSSTVGSCRKNDIRFNSINGDYAYDTIDFSGNEPTNTWRNN